MGGADLGEEVVFAGHAVQLQHLRQLAQARRHIAAVRAAVVADGDEGGEAQPHTIRVHAQREALDHAALNHLLHALVHRRRGQAHLSGHVGVRTPAVSAQRRKNSGIYAIQLNIYLHRV